MTLKKYQKKKIAVLYGGWSDEREISIQTGKAILNSLLAQGFNNAFGVELTADNLDQIDRKNMDIAFVALHGKGGEDGAIQSYLEIKGIPYTGSKVLASAVAMNKYFTKKILDADNIPNAKYAKIGLETLPTQLELELFGLKFPLVVKPVSQGSAIGVHIVNTESELSAAIEDIAKYDTEALLETYIKGREFTVGIVGDIVLPVLEIISTNSFYDFEAKYSAGKSRHEMPKDLDGETLRKMQFFAQKTHEAVGAKGVSRVDIMMDEKRNIFVLEINTIPGMTSTSLLPDAAARIGINFDELVLRILDTSAR